MDEETKFGLTINKNKEDSSVLIDENLVFRTSGLYANPFVYIATAAVSATGSQQFLGLVH